MLKSDIFHRLARLVPVALMLTLVVAVAPLRAEEEKSETKAAKSAVKSPVGAWYGRAAHCPDGSVFCNEICNGACPSPCVPGTAGCTIPSELVMQPQLFSDGNVVATDSGDFTRFHTTAIGTWVDEGVVTSGSLRGLQ